MIHKLCFACLITALHRSRAPVREDARGYVRSPPARLGWTCLTAMLSCATVWNIVLAQPAAGADWITSPSYYTHDPVTDERVTQYSPVGPFYTFPRSDYRRSGYRHTRSSIQAGRSADHMHIIEEWGRPVRPYGEWRFPYRPYSVPYPAWGPPYAGLGQPGYHPYPPAPSDHGGSSAQPDPYRRQQPPPYYDGGYPSSPNRSRDSGRTRRPSRSRRPERGHREDRVPGPGESRRHRGDSRREGSA
ncbi:MAG: hypothetical protein ACQESR_16035 [Planctomycetota bacterium]